MVERTERLLNLLYEGTSTRTLRELAATLSVTSRTVQRDIDRLKTDGHSLELIRGRNGGVRLSVPTPVGSHRILTGRREELTVATSHAVEACTQGLRLISVEGEPGIGKSTLLDAIAEDLASYGFQVAWGRCVERFDEPGLLPWLQILDTLEVGAAHRILESTVDIEEDADSTTERAEAFRSFGQTLKESALKNPIAILIDDFHRADSATCQLLQYASSVLMDCSVIVVLASRDVAPDLSGDQQLALRSVHEHPRSLRVVLKSLKPEDSATLAASISDGVLSDDVLREIVELSNGNPLFIEHLARSSYGNRVVHGRSLSEIVCERLELLSLRANRILDTSALIGRDVDTDLLSLVHGLTPAALAPVFDEIERADIWHSNVRKPRDYRFQHVLVMEAISERISTASKFDLHQKIAHAIGETYGRDVPEHASELVHHLESAPSPETEALLLQSLVVAGEQAVRTYAWTEARSCFSRSLDLIENGLEVDTLLRARAHRGLGLSAHALALASPAVENLISAFRLYRNAEETREALRLARTPLTGPVDDRIADLCRMGLEICEPGSNTEGVLLSRLGSSSNDVGESRAAFSRSLEIARANRNLDLEAWTEGRIGQLYLRSMRLEDGRRHTNRASHLSAQGRNPDAQSHAEHWYSTALFRLGELEHVQAHVERSIEAAGNSRMPTRMLIAERALLRSQILAGKLQEADQTAERMAAYSPDNVKRMMMAVQAQICVYSGEFDRAESLLDESACDISRDRMRNVIPTLGQVAVVLADHGIDSTTYRSVAATYRTERLDEPSDPYAIDFYLNQWFNRATVAMHDGDRDSVQHYLSLAERFDPVFGGDPSWPSDFSCPYSFKRVLGRFHEFLGHRDQANNLFSRALTECEQPGAELEYMRTCLDYAKFLLTDIDPDSSVMARVIASQGLDRRASEPNMFHGELRDLMAQATRQGLSHGIPDRLSLRELEVLAIAASGRTNREISISLKISQHTVADHVSSILRKLGVRNRTEAGERARRLGLI